MRTYVQKMKPVQKTGSNGSVLPGRAFSRRSPETSFPLNVKPTNAYHSAQKSLQKEPETNSTTAESSRFGYDFAQIPLYSKGYREDIYQFVRNGTSGTSGNLPYLAQIQRSFGPKYDLSGVKTYIGGQAAETAHQIGAEAYTSGERIAFRTMPNLYTAAHEAAHIVQQRYLNHLSGDIGTKRDMYERHADAIAGNIAAGHSAENLLNACAGTAPKQSFSPPIIQCLGQTLPYIGPLASYLNPTNQLLRVVGMGLTPHQVSVLDGVFGYSLATSIIRLFPNSPAAAGGPHGTYRTIGNIIHMPGTTISDRTLIHEATHVWQHQNTIFGVGYAVSALRAMAIAQVLGGDWQRAYDYRNVERYRIPWRYWNAEQQASWVEDHRRLPSGWMLQGQLPELGVESAGIE